MNDDNKKMKIGILGSGHIGKLLAAKLSLAGHDIKIANSGNPESIDKNALINGARAVWAKDIVEAIDVLIVSIPLNRIPGIKDLVAKLPQETVVIDTSNYYPARDGKIEALELGMTESLWVQEQLNRPITKAWNSIGSDSLATKSLERGNKNRICLSVAGDRQRDLEVTMALVEETGFDTYNAGALADSWKQQPGNPVYCTDIQLNEMPAKLIAANRSRAPKRRELAAAVFAERADSSTVNPDSEFGVRVSRAIFF